MVYWVWMPLQATRFILTHFFKQQNLSLRPHKVGVSKSITDEQTQQMAGSTKKQK